MPSDYSKSQLVRDLFERALEEQSADLEAWLAEATDDPDVRAEVRSLLHQERGQALNEVGEDRFPSLVDEGESEDFPTGFYGLAPQRDAGGSDGQSDEFLRQPTRPDRKSVSMTELLERVLHSASERTPQRVDCPDADRIWRAVQFQSPLEERLAVIDHVSECPTCAEAWRLSAELVRERTNTDQTGPDALNPEETPFSVRDAPVPSPWAALSGTEHVFGDSEHVAWSRPRTAIFVLGAIALAVLIILSTTC